MGIQNKDGALYFATGIDNTGLYKSRREAIGIIKAMADEITSFDVFGGIGISAGIAFARAAKESYDFEKRFQKAMLEVATLSKEVDGSLTEYMNRVMDMIRDIPIAGDEAAKALYQIVSAGHDGANGMEILEVSAKAATGGLTETATAADAITTILNAYGMQADKAKSVSDKLFTTVRLGKTTFGELGTSIAQAAPIAASFGISLDDVLAAVATITKQGVPTSEAMTKIRAAILGTANQLGDAAFQGRTFQEALQLIYDKADGSATKMKELLGTDEALQAALALTGKNAKGASKDLAELGNSAGAAETAFKKMNDSTENQLVLLRNNITAALRPMGEEIMKQVADIAESFNNAFSNGDLVNTLSTLQDLLVVGATAWGSYRVAVLLAAQAELYQQGLAKGWTLSMQLQANWLNIVSKAKEILAMKTKALNAIMAKSPYVLIATAITALGYAIYKHITYVSEAEKANRKLNESYNECIALQLKEKRELDDVFSALARAKEGTEERRKVINLINGQYGSYLSNMLTEKSSAEEIKSAYDRINASLKEKIALQIQNQATDEIATSGVKKQADELENLRKGLSQYSNNDGLVELTVQNIVDKVTEAQRAGIGNRKVFWDLQRELVNGIAKDAKELNDEVVEALDEYIRSVYSTEYNIYQAKKRFAPFIKGLTSVNTGTTTTTTTTTGTTVVNTEPDKKDYKGDIENAKKEQGKLFEQFSMDLQQMRIDAMEEGEEKYQAQRRLDFQKELFSIKEHGEALIKAQQEIEKKQWEERNKGKKNNEKGVFKPTTTSIEQLPQEQKDLLSNMYSEAQVKNLMNEEKILKEKYDALIAQLDDYKSREYTITKEWDEKIAQAAGNEELVDKLTKGKEKALNELNAQMLMQSDEWVKSFGDLDNLTISEIENLIQIIKSKAKDLKLDPINLDKVLEKLKGAENEIKSRNPFRSLVTHIKEYQKEADKTKKKASLKEIFGDTSEVLGMVNECFDSVIGGLKNMGLAGDEETQKLLGSISNMVGSAGKLADGIASMNPATMISGAVGLISSAFDVFDRRSRKANRAIKQHQENAKNLEKQYRQLERETAKAIGSEKYSKQIEQVNNLYQKIAETEGMIAAEQSKRSKKRDDGKIADWESQIEDYRDKIDELKQGIVDELSTTDLYSFSNDMASSIVDGLCNGLDNGKEAIQEKINDLMKNVIAKQFDVLVIQNAMEDMFQAMAEAVDPLKAGGVEITNWEMDQIVAAGQKGKDEIMNSLGRYKAILERLGLINDDIEDKIENGVTGELQAAVTEGTASQLVGLWNMSALDIRSLLNLSHEHFIECRKQLANIANIYVQIVEINNNTKATADNTETLVEELKTGIKSLETKLDEIRKNTKNYNGRG
jgi:phage tail tape measure protein, TP901 family